jgi:cell division protein FtsB
VAARVSEPFARLDAVCYAVAPMKWLAVALAVTVVLLQYRVWLSADGVREVTRLQRAVAAQRTDNVQLADRNRQLAAEVRDLKTGMDALEERARSDLGMVGRNETFYQVVPARPDTGRAATRTAAR